MKRASKIGLALGGGGARGLAHIGVIKALEAASIPIHAIAGTSMGALVGAWYAATKDIRSLEDVFLKIREKDMAPLTKIFWKHDGVLFKNKTVADAVESGVKGKRFKDCLIPFAAVATNVKNGDEIIMKDGSLSEAVRASIAVPFVFPPVQSDSKLLMDGGFVNPIPADIVRNMGVNFVIAVDVTTGWVNISEEAIDLSNAYKLMDRVITAIEYQIARERLQDADLVVHPAVSHFDWLDFPQAAEIIRAGEGETRRHLKDIYFKTGYTAPPKTAFDKFIDFLLYRE